MKTLDLYDEATALHDSQHCLACGEPKMTRNNNFLCGRCFELWLNHKESPFNNLIRDIDVISRRYIQSDDLRAAFMIGGDMYWEISS